MWRNWKLLGLPTFALLAFTTLPALAGGDRDGPQSEDKFKTLEKQIKDQLDELHKSIKKAFADVAKDMDDLRKEVKGNQEKTRLDIDTLGSDIDSIKKQVQQMQADIKALKQQPVETPITNPADKAALEEIKVRLGKIEAILNELRPGNGGTTIVQRPPLASASFVLVNAYSEEVRFTINGKTYVVPAFSTQVIENVQPGLFSYVASSPSWGVFGRNTINLSANETFTITARP